MSEAGKHHKAVNERIMFDSEYFRGLSYEIVNGHVIIIGGKNGMLAISIQSIESFASELLDIHDTWEGVTNG